MYNESILKIFNSKFKTAPAIKEMLVSIIMDEMYLIEKNVYHIPNSKIPMTHFLVLKIIF